MEKILIVDDIAENRKLLSKMLKMIRQCEIIEAENGKEAISIFKNEGCDLILMDVNMPIMNGYEAATAIKSISDGNYVPIIFITALSVEASLAISLESGGDDFISKPFNAEVLASKINAHIRIRELNLKLNDKNSQLKKYNSHLECEQYLIKHFFDSALKRSYLDSQYIKYHMSAMATFNGDLFLSERRKNGGLFIIVGDFTGHGLTASMGTLPVAMIFFKMVHEGASLSEIANELNHQLHELMPVSMFFAATIIELDAECKTISVWIGGMPNCYLMAADGELKSEICSSNMSLGIMNDSEFKNKIDCYNVSLGDKIYLYSDGITEAKSPNGELYGDERIKNIIINKGDDRFNILLNDLEAFTKRSEQSDDITLVEITCDKIPKK